MMDITRKRIDRMRQNNFRILKDDLSVKNKKETFKIINQFTTWPIITKPG
jgi:hypothetical protein